MERAFFPDTKLFAGRRWAVGMAIVTSIALVHTVPSVLKGDPPARILLHLSLWVLETPLQMVVLSLAFDWAARRRIGPTRLLVECLALAAVVGAVFLTVLLFVATRFLGVDLAFQKPTPLPIAAAIGAAIGVVLCGIWALAFVYPYAAEQSRIRALETDRLRLEADQLRAAAELSRLRAQLEPHFLLNTLNAVAGLVTQDPREARRLIGLLGDLLRDSLNDERELQPLSHEIVWLQRYAQILQARHGEALRFHWEVSDETRSCLLPRLLLQPLVENAVQHGALRRRSGGSVTVRTYLDSRTDRKEPSLVCVVSDNGPGVGTQTSRADAFGLRAVRRRLELRYVGATLRLESSQEGTRSIVELPIGSPALAAPAGAGGVA